MNENNQTRKIHMDDILCFFIILSPLLDMLSFWFRHTFQEASVSPSTVLRPLIPIVILIILFWKKPIKGKVLIGGLIYGLYAIIHLYIFQQVKTESSYGGLTNELQYIVNYTFMILNLFIYWYVFRPKDSRKIRFSVCIALSIYIISIFLAILTKTSSSTYIEGMGYKGWFESGNSLCAILCLCLCMVIPIVKERKINAIWIPIILLTGVFLTTLVGTRTGLLGFGLILVVYLMAELVVSILKKNKINKKLMGAGIVVLLVSVVCVSIFGSKTLERRAHLHQIEANIQDEETGETAHISGDLLKLKEQIEQEALPESYMSKAAQQSILDLYQYAQEHQLANNDMRMQQYIYNQNLVKNQKSWVLFLFGNGYKAQFRELVMEMEIPAFLFNFGLLGFILYFGPFLALFAYFAYFGIRHIRQIDADYILLVFGLCLGFILSFMSGYTFFYASASLLIVAMNVLLFQKVRQIEEKPKLEAGDGK